MPERPAHQSENEYCDYCGEIIFIGDKYYSHKGLRICSGCAASYAWLDFEEEASVCYAQFDQLLDMDD